MDANETVHGRPIHPEDIMPPELNPEDEIVATCHCGNPIEAGDINGVRSGYCLECRIKRLAG